MDFKNVHLNVENQVGYITIDHAPVNALNADTLAGLNDCLDHVLQDAAIKAVIITGEGKFFVAGADIKELTTAFNNKEKGEEFANIGQRTFDKIESFPKPVIAAINGASLGGGLELAMSCHMRIAAHEAKLGLPELNLGIIPGYGGTQRLSRLTNKAKALELILTSKFINGTEAERIGLVNHSVDINELIPTAKELAETIALEKSTVSTKAALKAVVEGMDMTMEDGEKLEAELFGEMFMTEDVQEGMNAFLEKRKAKFKDR